MRLSLSLAGPLVTSNPSRSSTGTRQVGGASVVQSTSSVAGRAPPRRSVDRFAESFNEEASLGTMTSAGTDVIVMSSKPLGTGAASGIAMDEETAPGVTVVTGGPLLAVSAGGVMGGGNVGTSATDDGAATGSVIGPSAVGRVHALDHDHDDARDGAPDSIQTKVPGAMHDGIDRTPTSRRCPACRPTSPGRAFPCDRAGWPWLFRPPMRNKTDVHARTSTLLAPGRRRRTADVSVR